MTRELIKITKSKVMKLFLTYSIVKMHLFVNPKQIRYIKLYLRKF